MSKHTDCEDEDWDENEHKKKDRNLFSELKEGIDELERRRLKKDLDFHGELE